jgi:hypothetical protein
MSGVRLARRAERDLRRIGPEENLQRLRVAMLALGEDEQPPDVRALRGSSPWLRLRVSDHRVVFRPIASGEPGAGGASALVARVVHRRDLERAVETLE